MLRAEVLEGRLSRRAVLKRATALGLSAPVIASLLAACGGDDDDTSPTATSGSGAATATSAPAEPTNTTAPGEPTNTPAPNAPTATTGSEPEPTATTPAQAGGGGLLKLLWWQAPTILNNHLAQGTKDFDASRPVLEPLAAVNADGELVPILAAEIPSLENGGVSADGLSVTWKLREGVTWSDGEPFTSADVAFTYEYTINPDTTSTTQAAYTAISTIETPDDYTVVVNFSEPNPAWFNSFVGPNGLIIPKHIMADYVGSAARDAPFNLKPTGTGPYMVTDFRPGDVVVYERNPNYWQPGKPFFDQVEFKGGGDATSAARAALQTGEVDYSWNLQVEATILAEMIDDKVGVLKTIPGVSVERILVNFADPNTEVDGARSEPTTQHPFWQYLEVRQASTYGIDRDTIATQLYGPAGAATTNVLVAPAAFASPNTTAEFNPQKGAEMLEAAGWTLSGNVRSKDGVSLNILYQTSTNPVRQKTQEIIKAGMAEMGMAVEIKAIDAGVYFSSDAGNPDTASHFYADWEMYTNGPSIPYPISYMTSWISIDPARDIAQKSNEWSGTNETRWVSEEFNALYTQALTELDPEKQAELFIGMNDLVVNNVVHIPLVHRANVSGHSVKLQGIKSSGWESELWDLADWTRED
ncbi:MAG: peptide ABC transporter substrate-binding protein [Chloroflexi bacterium]|nr:MAG: peptide ABC transporter substrate-binding protein [Chloroflexota bacterium]